MTQPIGCRDAMRQLWGYLDGALEPRSQEVLEAHLAWCLRCCGELEFALELRRFLSERAVPPLPADVGARLDRFVDQLDGPPSRTDLTTRP